MADSGNDNSTMDNSVDVADSGNDNSVDTADSGNDNSIDVADSGNDNSDNSLNGRGFGQRRLGKRQLQR